MEIDLNQAMFKYNSNGRSYVSYNGHTVTCYSTNGIGEAGFVTCTVEEVGPLQNVRSL